MKLEEVFQYLDDLRESGVTNMFGAGSYLEDELGLNEKTAKKYLHQWMGSFDGESTPKERALKVKSQNKGE